MLRPPVRLRVSRPTAMSARPAQTRRSVLAPVAGRVEALTAGALVEGGALSGWTTGTTTVVVVAGAAVVVVVGAAVVLVVVVGITMTTGGTTGAHGLVAAATAAVG
jgi:hypothetical protein